MVLGYWALVLPVVQMAMAAWLWYWVDWKKYKTLIPSFLIESAAAAIFILTNPHIPVTGDEKQVYHITQSAKGCLMMVVKAFVAYEVMRYNCMRMSKEEKLHSIGVAVLCGALGLRIVTFGNHPSPFESLMIFQQYWFLVIAAGLTGCWVSVRIRFKEGIGENVEHFAFRTMMTVRAIVLAISYMFTRGGILRPMSVADDWGGWRVLDATFYGLSLAGVVALAVWMSWSPSAKDIFRRGV